MEKNKYIKWRSNTKIQKGSDYLRHEFTLWNSEDLQQTTTTAPSIPTDRYCKRFYAYIAKILKCWGYIRTVEISIDYVIILFRN